MAWNIDDLPDLSDRTVLVTGANSGIGWEAARLLARRGARVVMACRSPEKARDAVARIHATLPTARLDLVRLDLGSLASVRACAAEVTERFGALDVLVNNAGIMAIPRALTEDGFEVQLGTNHFGHFALSGLLLGALRKSAAPRIVTVSSGVHWAGRIAFDDLTGERRYDKWAAYAQSKLANLLFTFEAHRRFEAAGVGVAAVACHPGYASTNLQGVGPAQEGSAFGAWMMKVGNSVVAQSAEMGALPTVHAAVAPDVVSGEVYGPAWFGWGYPVRDRVRATAKDPATAARLWEESERLTGVSWSV